MKIGKLTIALLALLLLAQALEAKKSHKGHKEKDEDDDDDDYGKDDKKNTDDDDFYDDEEDPDAETEMIDCNDKTCTCEKVDNGTITCIHVTFEESHHTQDLSTANIEFKNLGSSVDWQKVKLRKNSINTLKKGKVLPKLAENIRDLDMSDNRIRIIEARAFNDFGNLQKLNLSSNFLKARSMHNVLTPKLGKSLHQLDLSYNQFAKPKGLFDELVNLKKLVLDGNKHLEMNDDFFGKNLTNLEELSLDGCGLKSISDKIFDNIPNLKTLSLRNNPLENIPKAVDKLKELTHLDMSGTNVVQIDDKMINDDLNLEKLFFNDCKFLTMITKCAFCDLKNLQELSFYNCSQLHSIDDDAFGSVSKEKQIPKKIKKVNFGKCNLTGFYEDLLNWEDMEAIDMSENPLNCDCKLKWLIEQPKLQTLKGNTPARCAAPENVKNMTLNKVNDLVCPRSSGHVFFFSFLFFVLVVAAIFGFIFYTRRRGRLTNIFYRPEMPEQRYDNLNTNSNMDEGYTYSLNQESREEDV